LQMIWCVHALPAVVDRPALTRRGACGLQGLGKTLQAITLLWTLLRQGLDGQPVAKRVIIVCPTSLVSNWCVSQAWYGRQTSADCIPARRLQGFGVREVAQGPRAHDAAGRVHARGCHLERHAVSVASQPDPGAPLLRCATQRCS
jgi:hypothetical protein